MSTSPEREQRVSSSAGEAQPEAVPDRSTACWLSSSRHALILLALVVLALTRGLLYVAIVPPWQAPDEPWHFEYARLIADEGRLVSNKDLSVPLQQAIIDSMIRFRFWDLGYYSYPYDAANPPQEFNQVWVGAHQLHQQPLYYCLNAIAVWPWLAADVSTQLYVMRLFSVLLFAGTVVAAFLTARDLFPADSVLLVAISTGVLWHPMFTFISNSVNNDNLANLFMAWLIWLLVRWYVRGFTVLQGLAIVALLVLGTFTKRTTIFAWPLVAVAVPLYLWGRGSSRWVRLAWFVGFGVAIAGVLALVAFVLSGEGGPLLARLAGDLRFGNDVLQNPEKYQLTDPAVYMGYAQHQFITFWASFGWTAKNLGRDWYYVLAVINLVGAGGLGLLVVRSWQDRVALTQGQKRALVLLAVAFALALGIVVARSVRLQTWLPGDLPQGRYLFPVIVPIIVLLVTGLWQWIPLRYRRSALVAFLGTLVLFDTWCLLGHMVPFFYLK